MKEYYNIDELTAKISDIADFNAKDFESWKRKLRYWMQVCELEEKRIPGQTAYYSRATLDRLMFIKMILDLDYEPEKGKFKPTLSDIKNVLEIIGLEQIKGILNGEEPFEVGYLSQDQTGEPSILTLADEHEPLDTKRFGRVMASNSIRMSESTESDSALDYISQVMSKPPGFRQKRDWQTLKLGADLELRHRAQLTSRQEQQIKLAGKLIQSILSKEK